MIQAIPLVMAQHVVFEEIGRLARATSYIHVALHLDLHGIKSLSDNYATPIEAVRHQILEYDLSLLKFGGYRPTDVVEDLIQPHKEAHQQILDLVEFKLRQFEADLARIEMMYPSPITPNSLPNILTDHNATLA